MVAIKIFSLQSKQLKNTMFRITLLLDTNLGGMESSPNTPKRYPMNPAEKQSEQTPQRIFAKMSISGQIHNEPFQY